MYISFFLSFTYVLAYPIVGRCIGMSRYIRIEDVCVFSLYLFSPNLDNNFSLFIFLGANFPQLDEYLILCGFTYIYVYSLLISITRQ